MRLQTQQSQKPEPRSQCRWTQSPGLWKPRMKCSQMMEQRRTMGWRTSLPVRSQSNQNLALLACKRLWFSNFGGFRNKNQVRKLGSLLSFIIDNENLSIHYVARYLVRRIFFLANLIILEAKRSTYLLAPKLKPPASPVVAGALEGVPNENDMFS